MEKIDWNQAQGLRLVLTANTNEGKTTTLLKIAKELNQRDISMDGFAAPGIWNGDNKVGYNWMDIRSGQTIPFSSTEVQPGFIRIGRFWFNPEAVSLGIHKLMSENDQRSSWYLIDEIGPFELRGLLWDQGYRKLVSNPSVNIITVVRKKLIDEFCLYYHQNDIHIITPTSYQWLF